jgi:hypothetical protein
MKTSTRIAILGVFALVALAASSPAEAVCGSVRSIGPPTLVINTPGGPFPPYATTATIDIKGAFWSFGGGNPAEGVGNDSGTLPRYYWLYYFNGPTTLDGRIGGSHWAAHPGIDGCIDADGSNPGAADPAQCMVILLSDDADNGQGYFAILSVGPDGGQNYNFATATGGGPINLAPIPKPNITGSTRNGALSVDVSVNVSLGSGPAAGQYLTCQQAALTGGARYTVYAQQTGDLNGAGAPTGADSRDLSAWSQVAGPIPVGTPTQINLPCGGVDTEFYLCSTVEFPTGNGTFYTVNTCSQNATRVECGPNIAEPPTRRPVRKDAQINDRGGRR